MSVMVFPWTALYVQRIRDIDARFACVIRRRLGELPEHLQWAFVRRVEEAVAVSLELEILRGLEMMAAIGPADVRR
ncbi:MAG TPA: hypothetical protein VGE88_07040 [Lysobacter sp.]